MNNDWITNDWIAILEILERDARTPVADIAVMTGLTQDAVKQAIADMENKNIIVKYPALINWEKADRDLVQAIIEVRVSPQREQGYDAIASRIYKYDEVRSVFLMSGAYDLLLLVEAKSLKQLALFVSEKLATMDTVISTATHFMLKKYKTDGVILESGGDDPRLVVQP